MATSFVTARYPEQEVVRHTERRAMLRRTREFLGHNQARLRVAGISKYGRWRSADAIYDLVKIRTARPDVGPKIIIQRKTGMNDELSIREVSDAPTVADLGCHPGIEKSHALAYAKFQGQLRSGGIWYCRRIDGSVQISKHGYLENAPNGWKGAAEDTFVTEGGMSLLIRVAEWKVAQTKSGILVLQTVIVDDRIWTKDQGWHDYSGVRHYHIHEDVSGGRACNP